MKTTHIISAMIVLHIHCHSNYNDKRKCVQHVRGRSFLVELIENLEICSILFLLVFGGVIDPVFAHLNASFLQCGQQVISVMLWVVQVLRNTKLIQHSVISFIEWNLRRKLH